MGVSQITGMPLIFMVGPYLDSFKVRAGHAGMTIFGVGALSLVMSVQPLEKNRVCVISDSAIKGLYSEAL